MGIGWISVHRQIQGHWLWEDKPFSKGQAWIDLLLLANHEDKKFMLGNVLVGAKRGEVVTSEAKLIERWDWSKTKVRAFIKSLESDQMIIKKADSKKTTLMIVNYSAWQDIRTAKEPQKDQEETAKEPQKNSINNYKQFNNYNHNAKTFTENSDEFQLSKQLLDLILTNNPNFKQPDLQKWAAHIDKMLRFDKRTPEQIEQIIGFSQTDDFWKTNILSTGKLRKQFDALWIKKEGNGSYDTDKPKKGAAVDNGIDKVLNKQGRDPLAGFKRA